MSLTAAVIGCGFIGAGETTAGAGIQSHAAAWAHHPAVKLAALCDPDPRRLSEAGRAWQVTRLYREIEPLFDQVRPQIVSLATPDPTHAGLLERILMAPSVRAVLAEKPIALTVADAERL